MDLRGQPIVHSEQHIGDHHLDFWIQGLHVLSAGVDNLLNDFLVVVVDAL